MAQSVHGYLVVDEYFCPGSVANYVFFVSANPRALILIASTFTGIEISHQIYIVLFGLSRKFWSLGKLVQGTNFFMEHWSLAENFVLEQTNIP